MVKPGARKWSVVVLRGVLAILFALAAFVWPDITVLVLIWMFGIYALLDGLFSVAAGRSRRRDSSRGWAFLLKSLGRIAAGVAALIWPQLATLAIVLLVAGWAIVTGILEIAAAIRLRDEIKHEWLLGLGGIVSIVLGGFLLMQPFTAGIALIWTIAAYAMIFGVLLIALGFRLRKRSESEDRQAFNSV